MWTVNLSLKVRKSRKKLPNKVEAVFKLLLNELEIAGPNRTNWSNYSKLEHETYHCHIKKGHPTYVVVWKVESKRIKIIEVTYVGTHEKAPY